MRHVIMLLVIGALVFAGLAFSQPVRELPPSPTCVVTNQSTLAEANACYAQSIDWIRKRTLATPIVMTYQADADLAESLAVVALLLLLSPRIIAPESAKRPLVLPRLPVLIMVLVSSELFVFAEVTNILNAYDWGMNSLAHYLFYNLDKALPLHAFIGLVAASVGVALMRARNGISEGIRSGIVFGSVFIAIAQAFLLAFDYGEMYLEVAGFVRQLTVLGFPIINNWLVLMSSISIAVLGMMRRPQGWFGQSARRSAVTWAES
jgi:hypothetical protein